MKVLETVAGLWQETGGPASSVPGLCAGLSESGIKVVLLTGEGRNATPIQSRGSSFRVLTSPLGPYNLGHVSRDYWRQCRNEASSVDLIHTHGLWLFPNWASALAARRFGKPLVVSPRGMLLPVALNRSPIRKRISLKYLDGISLRGASLLHASSREEAEQFEALGLSNAVAVVPNGVDTDSEYAWDTVQAVKSEDTRTRNGIERVVFLGRIHPVKGIDLLLDAWRRSGVGPQQAELVLAGPGEPEHVRWLERELDQLGDAGVAYLGPVSGVSKMRLLAGASVVVVPSRSESYGMVVAESLACGTPVITTTATPWSGLVEYGCGWWVNATADELGNAISESLEFGKDQRVHMGLAGRQWVEGQHSSRMAARMMAAAYRWVLGLVPMPSFVTNVRDS